MSCQNDGLQRDEWERSFCLPFYRGGYRDTNTLYCAAHSVIAGPGEELFGIYAVTPRAKWAGMNLAFLSEPVFDFESLRQRIERAAAFYRERQLGWTLMVCEDWIAPDLRDGVGGVCREMSLNFAMETFSMTGRIGEAEGPPELEIRTVTTREMRLEFADINAEGWNVPVEWTREILDHDELWSGRAMGYMGYLGDEPVSVAMAYPVEGMSYLSWGATRKTHRRRGYAEAVVRHAALQNVGGQESLFIASPMGVKLWSAMGFGIASKFSLYVSADKKD